MKDDTFINSTILGILIVGLGTTTPAVSADSDPKLEKCYGIVKAGMNVCPGNNHPCAGLSTKDGDPDEWMYVLEGTCNKIVNGSTKPKTPLKTEATKTEQKETAPADKTKNENQEKTTSDKNKSSDYKDKSSE
jgi:uncharacterized membrane protein